MRVFLIEDNDLCPKKMQIHRKRKKKVIRHIIDHLEISSDDSDEE